MTAYAHEAFTDWPSHGKRSAVASDQGAQHLLNPTDLHILACARPATQGHKQEIRRSCTMQALHGADKRNDIRRRFVERARVGAGVGHRPLA